jgi:glycosyltransferase involved in cell wall biosynthesis
VVRVLYLANMIRTKGALDVLRACKRIGAGQAIEFVFAGAWREADFRVEIEEFIEQNPGLPITWLGQVTGLEKARVFGGADLFVFPTYYPPEGHPWVIVEAMAAGLPVISTDQGAIRESVEDGGTGYIVEKRNPEHLAAKIRSLANDSDLRARMGAAGRSRYLAEFTEERMVAKMESTFREVLARPR